MKMSDKEVNEALNNANIVLTMMNEATRLIKSGQTSDASEIIKKLADLAEGTAIKCRRFAKRLDDDQKEERDALNQIASEFFIVRHMWMKKAQMITQTKTPKKRKKRPTKRNDSDHD